MLVRLAEQLLELHSQPQPSENQFSEQSPEQLPEWMEVTKSGLLSAQTQTRVFLCFVMASCTRKQNDATIIEGAKNQPQ